MNKHGALLIFWIFFSLQSLQSFALEGKALNAKQIPPQLCQVLFYSESSVLGVEVESLWSKSYCDGILISPTEVMTTASCNVKSQNVPKKISCANGEERDIGFAQADPAYHEPAKTDIIADKKQANQDGVEHDLKVYRVTQPFAMQPFELQMSDDVSNLNPDKCFIASYGQHGNRFPNYKVIAFNEIKNYKPHDHFYSLPDGAAKVMDFYDNGGPVYCETQNGSLRVIGQIKSDRLFIKPGPYAEQLNAWLKLDTSISDLQCSANGQVNSYQLLSADGKTKMKYDLTYWKSGNVKTLSTDDLRAVKGVRKFEPGGMLESDQTGVHKFEFEDTKNANYLSRVSGSSFVQNTLKNSRIKFESVAPAMFYALGRFCQSANTKPKPSSGAEGAASSSGVSPSGRASATHD